MRDKEILATARKWLESQKVRYLVAGGWNTLFGYCVGLGIYYAFAGRLHIVEIGVLANVIAITMAFVTYKLFVFKTRGNWLREYFRSYLVYGGMALLGIGMLWALVDGLRMPFWLAQGMVVLATIMASYVSHSRFTFRRQD